MAGSGDYLNNSMTECTLDYDGCQLTGSRFLCYEALIKMINSTSLWHIIIKNRYMCQGLSQYPVVSNVHSVSEQIDLRLTWNRYRFIKLQNSSCGQTNLTLHQFIWWLCPGQVVQMWPALTKPGTRIICDIFSF